MAQQVDYDYERDSPGADVDHPAPDTKSANEVTFERGVRGGIGVLISPATTQYMADNYFSNQSDGLTIDTGGTGWEVAGDTTNITAESENNKIGDYSVKMLGTDGNTYGLYQTRNTGNKITTYMYIYAPPPANIDEINFYTGSGSSTGAPTGVRPLGDYWYLMWKTVTGSISDTDRYGIYLADQSYDAPIWIDAVSLTETDAPVAFIANANANTTEDGEDTNFKYAFTQAIPQKGTISLVFIPFFDLGDAEENYPRLLSFVPTGGDVTMDDYFGIIIDNTGSNGIYVRSEKDGGGNRVTTSDGYALTSFSAFDPHELIVTWDFTGSGSRNINIWVDGNLEVSSDGLDGISTDLKDLWIGCANGSGGKSLHFQGIIQDVEIYRRTA